MKPSIFLSSKRICFVLLVSLFLISSSCSKDAEPENQVIQDPLIEAKADFSNALSLWNQPKNFDRSSWNTETELLQNRLELVYEDAKRLLLFSGIDQETLQTKSKAEVFILAVKIYGGHYDN